MSAPRKAFLIAAAFGLLLAMAPQSAFAICAAQQEEGWWTNVDPNSTTVTRVHMRFVCQDVMANGKLVPPGSPWYIQIFWRCQPADCAWPEIGARRLGGYATSDIVGERKSRWFRRTVQVHKIVGMDKLSVLVKTLWHNPKVKDYNASVVLERLSEGWGRAPCPANTYQQAGSCLACPHGGLSNTGTMSSTECLCPKDTYIGESDLCVACPAGTHSEPLSVEAMETHLKDAHCKPN